MTNRLLNVNGKRIGYLAVDLSDGETSPVWKLQVVPAIGYELKATPTDADCEVQARETDSGDPWTDIGAVPISLSGYTPETPLEFDFRVVVGSPLVDKRTVAVNLLVASVGAAGW